MILLRSTGERGRRQLIVVGLTARNLEALELGHPIHLARASHGLGMPANLEIVIAAGENDEELEAKLLESGIIGPETIRDQRYEH